MRKQILLLGVVALAFGAAVRFATAPVPAVAVSQEEDEALKTRGDGRPRWEIVWTRPTPQLAAMDIAADGSVAWVDRNGSVRGMNARGQTLWQSPPLRGVNRLIAVPGGRVLAYAWLNPMRSSLTVLSPKTAFKRPLSCRVEGAIWNAAVSADGSRALVGTGQRYVYVFPLSTPLADAPPPGVRWRTPGIPESVAVASAQSLALVGTWQDPGVWGFGLDGTPRLQHEEAEPDRSYRVCLSRDGKTAVGISAKGPKDTRGRLHVWDTDTGRLLWKLDLEGSQPKALVTRHGQFIAVAYRKKHAYRVGETVERKLALFDRRGRRLWEKGGLFFSPQLVALSAMGERLTVMDRGSILYTLDTDGVFISKLRLPVNPKTDAPPTIREVVAAEDGAYLLIRRGDGQITLLKAT